jgi:hypothetical protein
MTAPVPRQSEPDAWNPPTETAKTARHYADFTDPMLRAASSNGGEHMDCDSLRWMGYADQELTRLRELLGLPVRPGYGSGRPLYRETAWKAERERQEREFQQRMRDRSSSGGVL